MPKYSEVVQNLLKEINDLRRSPSTYVSKLEGFLTQYNGLVRYRANEVPIVTVEGPPAVLEAIQTLQAVTSPLRECTWSEALASAAQAHVNDIGRKEIVGHAGSDDKGVQQRVDRCGRWMGTLVEMLDYGSVSATEIVCSLLVDDGMPHREHRASLLTPDLRYIGIGFGPHLTQHTMTTIVMVTKFTEMKTYEQVFPSGEEMIENWAAKGWVQGAVRMTCEVTSHTEAGSIKRRIIKRWEMADGSQTVTEELIST